MASTLKQLAVCTGRNTSSDHGSSQAELTSGSDPKEKTNVGADRDSLDTLPVPPHSPSPEAEYDKLLVSKETDTL